MAPDPRRRRDPADTLPGSVAAGVALLLAAACGTAAETGGSEAAGDLEGARAALVEALRARGIADEAVLAALRRVPRHRFVPPERVGSAYQDRALPIGHRQTISQPFVVALMTEAAELDRGDRVLEVGTGSGYQAAVLAEVAGEVYSIEILEPLAERARAVLRELGYGRVHLRTGDGYRGWPEAAPFDAIVVTAAPDHVPEALLAQLAPGGRLVIPVGRSVQELLRVRRTETGFERESLAGVRFVPMTGEATGEETHDPEDRADR